MNFPLDDDDDACQARDLCQKGACGGTQAKNWLPCQFQGHFLLKIRGTQVKNNTERHASGKFA